MCRSFFFSTFFEKFFDLVFNKVTRVQAFSTIFQQWDFLPFGYIQYIAHTVAMKPPKFHTS